MSMHIKTSTEAATAAGLMYSLWVLLLSDNNRTQPCGTFSFLERSLFPKLGFSFERFLSPTR